MADVKDSALPAKATPLPTDLVRIVSDPAGTPASMIASLANITKGLSGANLPGRRGASTFNGPAGRTVAIADIGTTDYKVTITPVAVGAYIGNISVGSKAANSFVVYNSGSDVATAFDYVASIT